MTAYFIWDFWPQDMLICRQTSYVLKPNRMRALGLCVVDWSVI